jgi:DNA primase large subunit
MRKVEGAKVYGLCLDRLEFQIKNALTRINKENSLYNPEKGFVLESYCTGDIDEIIDLLEIYDVTDRDRETIIGKLSEIAYSTSLLLGETIRFDFSEEGFLNLYFILKKSPGE